MTERAIELPFSIDSSGGISHTSSIQKILQDRVAAVILTRLGERVMRPNYGSRASNATFDNLDAAALKVKDAIALAIGEHLPYIVLNTVTAYVDSDQPEGYLNIEVFFSYKTAINNNVTTSIALRTDLLTRSGDIILEVANG